MSVSAPAFTVSSARMRTLAVIASLAGTTLEWYDFYLYGTASAFVFTRLFFPQISSTAGVLAVFATYAAGFVVRPVGAVIAGHVGDRYGRKAVLVSSLLLMGLPTAAIAVLPTYDQTGTAAPLLLMVLRLAQGASVGAEGAGAVLLATENSHERRGLHGSAPQLGGYAGMLLSTAAFAATRAATTPSEFLSWGWRLPFAASLLLVLVGYGARRWVAETATFTDASRRDALVARPWLELFRTGRRSIWLTIGLRLSQNTVYFLYTVFIIKYLAARLGSGHDVGLTGVIVVSGIGLITIPLWAATSDRIGRRKTYLFGACATATFIAPFFILVDTGSTLLIIGALAIGLNLCHDAMYGPQAAWFVELFDTQVRYSGTSIAYQLGAVVSGAFSPLIAATLVTVGDGQPWLICVYVVLMSAGTVIAALLAPETR